MSYINNLEYELRLKIKILQDKIKDYEKEIL